MKEFLRRALTRTVVVETKTRQLRRIELEPSDRLLYVTILLVCTLTCLVALEIAHLLVLGCWNSEVFSVVSGLIGAISGIVLARRG